ncbi:MAG TPA: LysR substrate-binding domain-containing protein [Burkholderiaceae bacterium]|nr:LysR substrate-binding domain-containing protein [Burkholderiaceae bacterium]
MTVNFKLLKSFVTAVDANSLSAAASRLQLAQPALSQQIAALESHFKQKLLVRSNMGVTPTDAGRELYRHAIQILGHLEQAEFEVARKASVLAGKVSVGIATYSSTSILATPLLKAVRDKYPNINLFINDNFGLVLSEMVMTGRMDMAIIYASGPIKGVALESVLMEELFLIAPPHTRLPPSSDNEIRLAALAEMDLLLPGPRHFLRRLIDNAFAQVGIEPRVAAEIESAATLRDAIEAGLGATILPWAVASNFAGLEPPVIRRVIEPTIQATVSLCVSDHLTMSDSALAVREVLDQLVRWTCRVEKIEGDR